MVDEAVKDKDKESLEETPEEIKDAEAQKAKDGAEDQPGADEPTGDGQEVDGEVDIVREGDTLPPTGTPRGFLKRINKLNGKVVTANQETSEERNLRVRAEEERDVYKARLAQVEPQTGPPAKPNPDSFDGGHLDPDYLKAVDAHRDKEIQAKVDAGIQAAQQQTTVTAQEQVAAQALETAQIAHCDRAAKLKVKDYEATEDKALEIFGKDHANHLIQNLDNSEVALYYFGKNPEVAQKYADMLRTQPIKALIAIGGLLSEIKIKPKSEPAPDPDIELEGGSPSNLEAMQTKLNKLRDAARSGGSGMSKLMAFKRQMKEKGIELR